jgi:hypothetical protein
MSEQRLRNRFAAFVTRRGGRLQTLIETADIFRSRGWTAFAFGGTPRGVYDNGNQYSPRDVDLVFKDEHFPFFESAFESYILRRNSYGGLRLQIKNLAVDAWPLSATWAFREGYVENPSFERLPATSFLNIDGIIVELIPAKGRQRRVFECGFFSGWKAQTLDINLIKNPHPSICVVRTLHISKTFGFQLSPRLAVYMWDMLGRLTIGALEMAQLKHYGYIEFAGSALLKHRQHLERHLNTSPLLPITLFPPEQMELHEDPGIVSRKSNSKGVRARNTFYSMKDRDVVFMEDLLEDTIQLRWSIGAKRRGSSGKRQ